MPTEFNDSLHYGFFMTGTKLTSATGKYTRQSELTLAALRAGGVFDNMEDGTVPPALDRLWLDKNTDPAVLKEWDPTGSSWAPMTFDRLFGRAIVTALAIPTGTGNAVVVAEPSPFIPHRMYSLTPIADNSGAVTIQVTGVGTYDVRYTNGAALSAQEFKNGKPTILLFTGVRFEVLFALADIYAIRDQVVAIGAMFPSIVANTMLVDNAAGTARENKTFPQVKALLNISELTSDSVDADKIDGSDRVAILQKLGIDAALVSANTSIPDYDAGSVDSVRTLLSNADGKHKHFANITRDGLGRVYVTYRHADEHGVIGNTELRMLRIDNNGHGPTVQTTVIAGAANRDARDGAIAVLPSGRVCLVYSDVPVSGDTYFKALYSDDRGDTFSAPVIIDTMADPLSGRIYGGMSLVPSPNPAREFELIVPYYLTRPGPTYERGYYISTDGVTWAKETAEGYPVVTTTALQNEMAIDAVNQTVWFAAIRDDNVDEAKVAFSINGRASWSAFTTIATGTPTLEESPALKIVRDGRGIPYVLIALTNRATKKIRWTWAKVRDVVANGGAAFYEYVETGASGNAYATMCDFGNGQMLYAYGNEPFGEAIPDPTALMLGHLDYGELISGGRVFAFTPVFRGVTTPGAPTGTFTGWWARDGSRIYGQARGTFTSLGGMVGAVQIDLPGLPPARGPGLEGRGGAHVNFRSPMTNYFVVAGYVIQSTNTIALVNAGVVATNVLASDMAATTSMMLDFSYFTS